MRYRVRLTNRFKRSFRKLARNVQERIEEAVDDMRTEALEVAIRWCDENKVPSICIITKELIDSIENATDK